MDDAKTAKDQRDVISTYYTLAADFAANASTTQLSILGLGLIIVLPLFFGIPIFFLLLGILIGIYIAFTLTSGFATPELEVLPWKRKEFSTLGFFSDVSLKSAWTWKLSFANVLCQFRNSSH